MIVTQVWGDGGCGGEWGEGRHNTEPTQYSEYHTEIDDCYTGLGVTGDVGGVGGRTSQY